ncbi:MAG: HNH endonuclease [Candidatus Riflebacteria bacterium]|nr:HNH endonuclease [Candidatus Riflebacteria bacterium]
MKAKEQYLKTIQKLHVYHRGERRAPHKPLLLLLAISKLLEGDKQIAFPEIEASLIPLLEAYAPSVKARHQPELPYWHLQSDGLWIVEGADLLPLQAGGFPRMQGLRDTRGFLDSQFAKFLTSDHSFRGAVVSSLLEGYFPKTRHEDILEAVNLPLPQSNKVSDLAAMYTARKARDPGFSIQVLRAYEHKCAVSGFRAALAGRYFGCEAAHIQWHAYDGPDIVENGLALEPTIHKLFDAGAWSLTDDRRVIVSAEFTGSDETIKRIRALHGVTIRAPLNGQPEVSKEFIRWHREPRLGAVFRLPALPL